jgi:hypothetical protein
VTMTTVDLRVEAAAEARRLTDARALLCDGDERAGVRLEGDAAWIAMPRRASVKRRLGKRLCLVWRVVFEDASGRCVESRLVPVILELRRAKASSDRGGDRRRWIQALLRDADDLIRAHVEASCDQWRAEVIRSAEAFAAARRRRDWNAAWRSDKRQAASQPGLFDRRADRSRDAHASARADAERIAAERRQAIAVAAEITPQPARLLLVLAP